MAQINVLTKLSPPVPTKVYDTYWKFAAERQAIFFRRASGTNGPWTDDLILREYKFTNTYRSSDRVSQFLIRNVIYGGDQAIEEIFFRCILFKIFNRESTWQLLQTALGEVRYSSYSFAHYDKILKASRDRGDRMFSAAYIMPSHSGEFADSAKYRNYLKLLENMMADRLATQLAESSSMASAFELLRHYPLIGPFLAYQFVTDLNYSTIINFSEMDFVIPGPGAKSGIRKCFASLGDFNESDLIRFVCDKQESEFARLGLNFRSLWGRRLQLIDCQNLFCEVDKYARLAHPDVTSGSGRNRIKQKFAANSQVIHYWFPPKWGINLVVGLNSSRESTDCTTPKEKSASGYTKL